VLSLPLYPELDEPEIRAVVDAVHDAARSIGRGGGEPSQRSS
jgi:dTDP-4-amino-4,6-dideoxygalactose transaminase